MYRLNGISLIRSYKVHFCTSLPPPSLTIKKKTTTIRLNITFANKRVNMFPHPDVLEEPGTHDAGGVLGQNAPLCLRRVFILTQEAEILVQLQLELRKHTVV